MHQIQFGGRASLELIASFGLGGNEQERGE